MKLNILSFALACGLAWAIYIFCLGILDEVFGLGAGIVSSLSTVYIDYSATFTGSIIGAIWAFTDGACAGAIVAFFYNTFSKGK